MINLLKKQRVLAIFIILLLAIGLAACGSKAASPTAEEAEQSDVARPSNGGGPGAAVGMTGDATAGAAVFATTCVPCHGAEGKGGVPNAGSKDGTIPPLNPIDSTLISSDAKTYATNLDLFIEHGSKPEGPNPQVSMIAFGDTKALTPQQIADVIAYVISLNKK